MDIDLVYTWVNPRDEARNEERARYARAEVKMDYEYRGGVSRFQSRNEIRHSIASSTRYLPFIRKIFLVCGGPPDDWMCRTPNVHIVDQNEILPPEIVPVFQSDIIEAYIHRIPGLADHYLYSNDDFFLARPHSPEDFFDAEGRSLVGVDERFVGLGGLSDTYGAMELNAARALRRHLKLPNFVGFGANLDNSPISHRKSRISATLKRIPLLNVPTHVTHPYHRLTWVGFHNVFAKEMAALGTYRLRSEKGYTVNLMYHHFARSVGQAAFHYDPSHLYLDATSKKEERDLLLKEVGSKVAGTISRFCLNDVPSEDAPAWEKYVDAVMAAQAA